MKMLSKKAGVPAAKPKKTENKEPKGTKAQSKTSTPVDDGATFLTKGGWNSFQTDLTAYKLSETELMKRKAERTSKNHIEAKSGWREKIEKLETGEITAKDLDIRQKPANTPVSAQRRPNSREVVGARQRSVSREKRGEKPLHKAIKDDDLMKQIDKNLTETKAFLSCIERGDIDQAIKLHYSPLSAEDDKKGLANQPSKASHNAKQVPADEMLLKVDSLNDEIRQLLKKYADPVKPSDPAGGLSKPSLVENQLSVQDRIEFGLANIDQKLEKGRHDSNQLDESGEFQNLDDIFGKADGLEEVLDKFDVEERSAPFQGYSMSGPAHDRQGTYFGVSTPLAKEELAFALKEGSITESQAAGYSLGKDALFDQGKMDVMPKYLSRGPQPSPSHIRTSHDPRPLKHESRTWEQPETSSPSKDVYHGQLSKFDEDIFSKDDASFLEKMKQDVLNTKKDIDSLFGPDDPSYLRLTGNSFNPRHDSSFASQADQKQKFNPKEKFSPIELRTTPSCSVIGGTQPRKGQSSHLMPQSTMVGDDPLSVLKSLKATNQGPVHISMHDKPPVIGEHKGPVIRSGHPMLMQQEENDEAEQPATRPSPVVQKKVAITSQSNVKEVTSYYDMVPSLRKKTTSSMKPHSNGTKPKIAATATRFEPDEDEDEGFCLKKHLRS